MVAFTSVRNHDGVENRFRLVAEAELVLSLKQ